MKDYLKKTITILLAFCLTVTMIDFSAVCVYAEDEDEDDTQYLTKEVNYDLVEFGTYPQIEIVSKEHYSGADTRPWYHFDEKVRAEDMSKYFVEDDTLYGKLAALGDDAWTDGETTLEGTKYCRVKASDVIYQSTDNNHYDWSDQETYRYFKYMPIKWRVLKTGTDYAYLMADQVLDFKKLDDPAEGVEKATAWKDTTLYKWLNEDFIGKAFSSSEQEAILPATSGKVSLPSEEAYTNVDYGFNYSENASDKARQIKGTTYARALGAYAKERGQKTENYLGATNWFLSTSKGTGDLRLMEGDYQGSLTNKEMSNNGACGILPVLYVKTKDLTQAGETGNISVVKIPDYDFTKLGVQVLNKDLGCPGPVEPQVTCEHLNKANYEVTYENNRKTGTGKAIIKGEAPWTGTIEITFQIKTHLDISASWVTLSHTRMELPASGNGAVPEVTVRGLTKGVDYEVTILNNKAIGTGQVKIMGLGLYTGSDLTKTFEIVQCVNHDWEETIPVAYCFGPQNITRICKKCGKSEIVEENGVPAAPHTPVLSTLKATFTNGGLTMHMCYICESTLTIDENVAVPKVTLSKTSYVYNGKKQVPKVKLTSVITAGGEKTTYNLVEGQDYKLKNNTNGVNVGKHTITVTLMGDRFGYNEGSAAKTSHIKKVSYSIKPQSTKVSSVKALKKGFKVKWYKKTNKMKSSRITGYQVQYASNSKFTKSVKSIKVKGYSKYYKEVKKLKAKKKYYVRVRTYMVVSGKYYYSDWSKGKSVTTKK